MINYNTLKQKYYLKPNGFIYTVFKVKYNKDSFFMAGNQFGFDFKSDTDIDNLLATIILRLEDCFNQYNLTNQSILYVQIIFRKIDSKLLSEFSMDKPNHISITDIASTHKKLNIPISVSENSLGKPLDIVIVDGVVKNIPLTIKDKKVNFLDIIKNKVKFLRRSHKDVISSFDSSFIYLRI